ncbi:Periplasmic chorismate mutase I precursor-like protein [Leptotrombidium deliense]|uniref:chorismate mutase n=1 Tax=Leptotrombidium deliense TaxID=299467 RepID=A0A443S8S7_9ACAR|nr:Periplasmic chorismate mutase I precursor-like protein [Leptotrombidium deliense]
MSSVLLHNATETKTTTETPEQTEVNEFWTFLNLVKRRLLLGYKVAIVKYQNNITVEAPKREQTILNSIVEKAKTYNLSEEWSRKFFQDQMDANKYVQTEFIEKWKNGTEPAPTEEVKLETVRRLIDTLNSELFVACVATENFRSSANCTDHVESQRAIIVTLLNSDPIYTKAMEMALKNACLTHKNETHTSES